MNNENNSKSFSSVIASRATAIHDPPIVSISDATLGEITTTTTSTKTTPTPTPAPTLFDPQKADNTSKNQMSDVVAGKTTTAVGGSSSSNSGGGSGTNAIVTGGATAIATSSASGTSKKETSPPIGGSKSSSTDENTGEKKSEAWDDVQDLDDVNLKNLLEEAYSYKLPRDKKDKSQRFLDLLQQAESENENEHREITPLSSNSNRHRHHHNHHKQGGSLQDLVNAGGKESLLDSDYTCGAGQRNRRHNHNSRQKKYSSVSSRQREGGSLPSNVNVTNCLFGTGIEQPLFTKEVNGVQYSIASNTVGKPQRRTSKFKDTEKEGNTVSETACGGGEADDNCKDSSATVEGHIASATAGGSISVVGLSAGDCVIEMGEPIRDIQQQQQILQSRTEEAATQGLPHYDNYENNPRPVMCNAGLGTRQNFAPSNSHNYVDEKVIFGGIERSTMLNSNAGVGAGASNAVTTTSTASASLKSSSSTIDSKYLPLDENYKSCKSMLGEYSTKPRSCDENGNSVHDVYQSGYQCGPQAAAAGMMNASVGGINASSSAAGSINAGNTKSKSKKKSQKDNTKTVDVESVAGYRGGDPVEELVKYIESDKQNDTKGGSGKFNDSNKNKKERKKDKQEKQHKIKKSNSLEELRSCSKIDVDDLKRTAATTESGVMMRNKSGSSSSGSGSNGNKQNNKNGSSSTADINKSFESGSGGGSVKEMATTTGNNSKSTVVNLTSGTVTAATNRTKVGERRSWGTEELQYLGENSSNEEKTKEKKANKHKEKEADKETKDVKEKIVNITAESKLEKAEKLEKIEKRKKSESNNSNSSSSATGAANTTMVNVNAVATTTAAAPVAVTVVDILEMDSLVPETAEFHVVTKKRKPKKQRTSDETNSNGACVTFTGFNRSAHNFMTTHMQQKSSGGMQQQQQQRYKYSYNSHVASSSYTGNNERGGGGDYVASGYHNNSYNSHSNTCQQQQQPQQQHQPHNVANSNVAGDKSRRKSTSSVPPSEKSDSSDLDSVHSLPIESSNTISSKNKQRHKTPSTASGGCSTPSPPSSSGTNNKNNVNTSPAPISYADIARTNKELQAAAAASAAADKWPAVDATTNNNSSATESVSSLSPLTATSADETVTNASAAPSLKVKTKKMASKPDFPELVAITPPATIAVTTAPVATGSTATITPSTGGSGDTVKPNTFKLISYSQSLSATPVAFINSGGINVLHADAIAAAATAAGPPPVAVGNNNGAGNESKDKSKIERRSVPTELIRTDDIAAATAVAIVGAGCGGVAATVAVATAIPAMPRQQQLHQQQQQQQPLQKSKSVEHDSYSFNSSNLDQQYPALEKTVKRHSATNVAGNSAVSNVATAGAQFNFAAAAKQQINVAAAPPPPVMYATPNSTSTTPPSQLTASTTTSSNNATVHSTVAVAFSTPVTPAAAVAAIGQSQVYPTTTIPANNRLNNVRKPKEKSPIAGAFTAAIITSNTAMQQPPPLAATNLDANTSSLISRKNKKERQQQQQFNTSIESSTGISEFPNVAQKSTSTATQTSISKASTNMMSTNNKNHKPNALATGNTNSRNTTSATTTAATTLPANRPAVIILNDDRAHGASSEFTFGDFNEDELKFFDDSIAADEDNVSVAAAGDDIIEVVANANVCTNRSQKQQQNPPLSKSKHSSMTDVANNSTLSAADDIIIVSNTDASANTLYNVTGSGAGQVGNHLVDKTKSINNNSINNNNKRITPSKDVPASKLNTFLNAPTFASNNNDNNNSSISISASATTTIDQTIEQTTQTCNNNSSTNDNNNDSSCPPPQQLETCNDIEAAIIAAARAAAEQQQLEQIQHNQPIQPQQQPQYQNTNSFSNSSSFSSSSSVSVDTKYPPPQSTAAATSTTATSSLPASTSHNHYSHTRRQSYENEVYNTSRSHSNSSSQRDTTPPPSSSYHHNHHASASSQQQQPSASVVVSIQRKEFDIHFIPPTMSTALSSLQHNDIIVDFIGSAWEEVAKATKFYDGQ